MNLLDIFKKKIKNINCELTDPFGGDPVLTLYSIEFEDGSKIFIEGEHDTAYIPLDGEAMNRDVLESMCADSEDNGVTKEQLNANL